MNNILTREELLLNGKRFLKIIIEVKFFYVISQKPIMNKIVVIKIVVIG